MKRKSGEITVFLSLVFILLISFVLSMMESVFIQTAKNQSRLDVDKAVFSLFGEYQKELLEEYELFAFDASYGSGEVSENQILNRLVYYGSTGMQQEITGIQFLTDNNGQAFREGVIRYMEAGNGIEVIREMTGLAQEWSEQEVSGEAISNSLNQSLQQNCGYLPEEAKSLTEKTVSGNFISLVLPKDFQLSQKSVVLTEQVSQRTRNTGRGFLPVMQGIGGIEEKLLFQQYAVDKFSSATGQRGENRSLDYEIEYLICGKSSDKENLQEIITKLLFFRLAMNYMYLQTDIQRQQEAATFAAAIAAVLMNPGTEAVIRQLLLILWAFGESVLDIRVLLEGKKAAFYKTNESWQLTLSSLFTLGSSEDFTEGADEEGGLDYTHYLQILLCLESTEGLAMRALDRIEQNLIIEKGLSNFRADACVTKLKTMNTAEIGAGYQYSFPTYFGYL
ncbi:MAG: DUF5702 domain-containing protein [Schaedlerella sp.]|nr:DUF5702 domain-containing protein [Schaedlerella sp.]